MLLHVVVLVETLLRVVSLLLLLLVQPKVEGFFLSLRNELRSFPRTGLVGSLAWFIVVPWGVIVRQRFHVFLYIHLRMGWMYSWTVCFEWVGTAVDSWK